MRKITIAFSLAVLCFGQQPSYDLVITGGRIVDGSGNNWFYGDLAVSGDRIARITPPGMLRDTQARRRIDAANLVVAPGFIDIQGWSLDPLLSGDSRVISHVAQGITTEIMGEGWTPAPSNKRTRVGMVSLGRPATEDTRFDGDHGFDTWLRTIEQRGASLNFGSFVGAASVRQYVMGMEQGAASASQIEEMKALIRNGMVDGAFGLSSALIYPPGEYASTHELSEISKVMSPFGGVYITHMRSQADRLLEAIDEALTIGREGGVPVEIYHLKAGGQRNWSKMPQAIAKIENARKEGQDVGADMYPYAASSTGLTACLPPWTSAGGKLFENLADPTIRTRIKAEMAQADTPWENFCQLLGPENVLVLELQQPANQKFRGKRLSEIAATQSKDWRDAVLDLLLFERTRVMTIYFMMSEENLALQLRQPWIKIGTDSPGLNPENAQQLAHPRAYGTFPRVLGEFVREKHVIPLEEAIRKMTSATARRLSLRDRGLLQPGLFADIVIFDPATVADVATYEKPHQIAAGIKYVLVNGTVVMQDGRHTGAKPGRAVRGPGYASN